MVLLSSIPDSSPAMNEDQVFDGVSAMQPICAIIHDEYVYESKEEPAVKDDSLPSAPHSLCPDSPCDSATIDFPCENSFMVVSTFDCSQDMLDDNLSLHFTDDKSSSKNASNLSSVISKNNKGERPFFSSTPLRDSSNHEDANKHCGFSDLGCRDLSTSSSNHHFYSILFNPSKPLVYDDLSVDKVETSQIVEAL